MPKNEDAARVTLNYLRCGLSGDLLLMLFYVVIIIGCDKYGKND